MPRIDLVVLDKKDKSCPNPNAKAFNSYTMNKQQKTINNNDVSFNDAGVQKALASDAVSYLNKWLKLLPALTMTFFSAL
jgi:hypothetical protein